MIEMELGRDALVARIAASIVATAAQSDHSHTHSLSGPWGSGKTWVLTRALDKVRAAKVAGTSALEVVEFNPWFYADENALYTGFARLLLQKTLKKGKVRTTLADLLGAIGPSAKGGGFDLSAVALFGAKKLGGLSSPEAIREEVSAGLHESGTHLLVVMDDLDRLNPEELLMLFKLVRLVGDVPRLSYLFSYDEDTLLHLIERTPIADGSHERARRYLEKIVQSRWPIPPLNDTQVEGLILDPLATKGHGEIDFRLTSLIQKVITTPRAAERYLQTFDQLPPRLHEETNFPDLSAVLFLRTFFPKSWSYIVEEREFMHGNGLRVALYSKEERQDIAKRLMERVLAPIDSISASHEVSELIQHLFPNFERVLQASDSTPRVPDNPRSVGDSEFMDRYLWLDLPAGALSEGDMNRWLADLPSKRATESVLAAFGRVPRLAIASVRRAVSTKNVDPVNLLRLFESIVDTPGGFEETDIFENRDAALERMAVDTLRRMTEGDLLRWINESPASRYDRPLLRNLALRVAYQREEFPVALLPVLNRLIAALADDLATHLEAVLTVQYSARRDVLDLRELHDLDPDRARRLALSKLVSLHWRADDFATMYLTGTAPKPNGVYRLQFSNGQLARDWGSEVVAALRESELISTYPEDWDRHAPDRSRSGIVSDDDARQLASFYMRFNRDFGDGPFGDSNDDLRLPGDLTDDDPART